MLLPLFRLAPSDFDHIEKSAASLYEKWLKDKWSLVQESLDKIGTIFTEEEPIQKVNPVKQFFFFGFGYGVNTLGATDKNSKTIPMGYYHFSSILASIMGVLCMVQLILLFINSSFFYLFSVLIILVTLLSVDLIIEEVNHQAVLWGWFSVVLIQSFFILTKAVK